MNYKVRLTFLFVGLFLAMLTAILTFVYIAFADFRRDEFFERLREKSINTARLLIEVKEVDASLLKIIDRNSINKLYDEKILVFDENINLIYSSLDDETIPYTKKLIEQIRQHEDKYFVDDDGDEVVGVNYIENGHHYVVLASAYDRYGISKLENLKNLVFLSLIFGTILIGVASYFYIRQIFKPIDFLNQSITAITEKNLKDFVPVKKNRDELDKLAINYNQMLARLNQAFESQRAFVRHAAHEFKTPLAVVSSKLEKLDRLSVECGQDVKLLVSSMFDDVDGLAELIESLLIIQRLQSQVPVTLSRLRIDELLDESIREAQLVYSNQKVNVDIHESVKTEEQLTISANSMLIKLCFRNLIRNAALHASDHELTITIAESERHVQLKFANAGRPLNNPELIFESFYRQPSDATVPGHGLGLSIVKQISELMKGTIVYHYQKGAHEFVLSFLKENS